MTWALHVKIFEKVTGRAYPVVEHIFRGRTKKEAAGYYEAHLHTDQFLYACVSENKFRSIACSHEISWRREK